MIFQTLCDIYIHNIYKGVSEHIVICILQDDWYMFDEQ